MLEQTNFWLEILQECKSLFLHSICEVIQLNPWQSVYLWKIWFILLEFISILLLFIRNSVNIYKNQQKLLLNPLPRFSTYLSVLTFSVISKPFQVISEFIILLWNCDIVAIRSNQSVKCWGQEAEINNLLAGRREIEGNQYPLNYSHFRYRRKIYSLEIKYGK